ncbi:putative GTP diphosphokinase RSH1, chloroplastic isoform X3 [Solanum tuberosum]|uniref:putative GTP diphosphokinase RSH1, chloroplastic isoform X3 n=1 Tax=Solanum tuberosum TaxID=4113 RepID=UPI000739FE15|nr:PREDICTED: putative GTP diphosphokinase RSH1, chloroplastic isoform X3 [Solanum tuberosum]
MASATSMSVSIECVNICKAWKGDVSGRLDCSVLSCAWKAPRALTGLLASTAHPSQCSSTPFGRYGRRGRLRRCGLSSKSAFQRHKQWLQHAKTRCARHKIMKFLREQAALSASEITVDSVKEFAAESEGDITVEELADYSKGTKHSWEKILKNVMDVSSARMSSEDIFQLHSGSIQIPKVNGKHNKCMQHTILKATGDTLSQGNGVGEMRLANIPRCRDVLPGLDGWLASKVATWQNLEGHSVQWFCVVSIDRKATFFGLLLVMDDISNHYNSLGMMADITSALAAVGVIICSCAGMFERMLEVGH